MLDDGKPIFLQIAESIADGVLAGSYPEGTQVPSTNELAAFHRINPATVGKGLGLLVDRGILHPSIDAKGYWRLGAADHRDE